MTGSDEARLAAQREAHELWFLFINSGGGEIKPLLASIIEQRDEARRERDEAEIVWRGAKTLLEMAEADRDSLSAQLDIANERLGESERQLNTAWIEGDRLSAQLAEAQVALDRADRVIEFAASKMPFFGAWADLACEALDRRKALSTPSPAHPEDGK